MLSLLSIVALRFFLGMRHATDLDHVIVVITIVARHRTLKHAGGLVLPFAATGTKGRAL